MDFVKWKNCNADGGKWWYGRLVTEFLNDIIQPSLRVLDARIESWSRSDDPAAPFHLNDINELYQVTTTAFCLSIQSVWERQIRSYVRACAIELKSDNEVVRKTHGGHWKDLDILFFRLRGFYLSRFPEYRYLNLLQLLANVCRHGDGPSSERLWHDHPEFWPNQTKRPERRRSTMPSDQEVPPASAIEIPCSQLQLFVDAIVSFWQEIEYTYLENIQQKHESVKEKLVKLRLERTKQREKWTSMLEQ